MSAATNAREGRLVSLDVLRGLIVLGMIVVNIAAYIYYVAHVPIYGGLLHASWQGFQVADLVFPAFIFIVGVSVALSVDKEKLNSGAKRAVYRKVVIRSLKLIVLGVVLSNLYIWFYEVDLSQIRILGVLQRIGITYFVAMVLYLLVSRRVLAVICATILILYWPLVSLPFSGGDFNIDIAGANFVSWFDRTMLGNHAYVKGELGYDPEGILSTLPAIAQCVMGVLFGVWLKMREKNNKTLVCIIGLGIIGMAAGLALGLVMPVIKDMWTPSYVFLSTGYTLLLFSIAYWVCEIENYQGLVARFFKVFGLNAIAAYTLHYVLSFIIVSAPMIASYKLADHVLPEKMATLAPVAIFCLMIWWAMNWLFKKQIFIKI